jgi:hypothetical protein
MVGVLEMAYGVILAYVFRILLRKILVISV